MPKTYRVTSKELDDLHALQGELTLALARAQSAEARKNERVAEVLARLGAPPDSTIEDDGTVTVPTKAQRLAARNGASRVQA